MVDLQDLGGPLELRLRNIRRRLRQRVFLRALFWAVAAGLASALCLMLLSRWNSASLALADAGRAPTMVALLVGVTVAACILALSHRPTLSDAARLSDHALGGAERFATAHEVIERGQGGVLARALVQDAQQAAAGLDPRRLVPVPLLRLLLFGAGLAALGLAPMLFAPLPVPISEISTAKAPDVADLALEERQALADDIDRVAAFMASQAEGRGDAYSAAVARTLENLSQRLVEGGELSRETVSGELASLRDYAMAATNEWRGTSGQRIPELLGALLDRVQQPQMVAGAESPIEAAGADEAVTSADMPAVSGQPQQPAGAAAAGEKPENAFSKMMAEAEAAVAGTGESNSQGAERVQVSSSYMDIAIAQNAAEMAALAAAGEDAQIIGASANAQAGDSQLAGEGTDGVDGGGEPTALTFESTDQIMLETTDTGEGQRVEKTVTPPTQRAVVADPADLSTMAGWVRSPEAEVARTLVDPGDRDLVSAYRMGLKAQAEQ